MIPCSTIYNLTDNDIAVSSDPNWDDQKLTYGITDHAHDQKILKKMHIIKPGENITICNKYKFDFTISNEYMTGLAIGNPHDMSNDAISLTLGIKASNTDLIITEAYNYSKQYTYLYNISSKKRTNNIKITSL